MITLKNTSIALALSILVSLMSTSKGAESETPNSQVLHRTVKIDGLDIFYREAGPEDAPTVLLLHGFLFFVIGGDVKIGVTAMVAVAAVAFSIRTVDFFDKGRVDMFGSLNVGGTLRVTCGNFFHTTCPLMI